MLQTTITKLTEQMKQMTQTFSKFQNYVEDKLSKIEVEQTDLKNRMLNLDRGRYSDNSPFSSI